jgi:hypothetical protein
MSRPAESPSPRTGRRRFRDRIAGLSPFGWGATKPHHFTDMARIAWRNRDTRCPTPGAC